MDDINLSKIENYYDLVLKNLYSKNLSVDETKIIGIRACLKIYDLLYEIRKLKGYLKEE